MKEKKPGAKIAIDSILAAPMYDFDETIADIVRDLDVDDRIKVLCIATTLRLIIKQDPRLSPIAFAWVASEQASKKRKV